MGGKRRIFRASFKAKVALAGARGDRTTAQLASQFGIHTSQVTAWKKQLMGQVAELFVDGRHAGPTRPLMSRNSPSRSAAPRCWVAVTFALQPFPAVPTRPPISFQRGSQRPGR